MANGRRHTRIGMEEYFWLYAGLELAMGPPTDRKLSAWEECFMPAKLMEHLKRVTIDEMAGEAELAAQGAHLVLEQA